MVAQLQRKMALVTAAGYGIGVAIAEAFAVDGATLTVTDVDDVSDAAAWRSKPALRPFRHARAAPPVFRRG
jgi:NAD(P)-dependent dehydrogenase (short-subunit alcohol dehydrogenase family)